MADPKQIEGRGGPLKETLYGARGWLLAAMPHVAIVAAGLFAVWVFLGRTSFYKETFPGRLLGVVTLCAVIVVCSYYGFKSLRWLKRKLLWRVRRRLVITYLFVGLTPIILLTLLGLLSAFGGSGQGLARIVTAQVRSTELETQSAARGLAESLGRLPAGADNNSIQAWLDERVALMRSSLPGARAALWRGATGEDMTSAGQSGGPQFVSSADQNEDSRGVGDDPNTFSTPLPDWLRGLPSWGGLAYTTPESPEENFALPSMRALVRGTLNDRPFALLLVVPVSRALVQRYREATGVEVRPFFVSTPLVRIRNGDEVEVKLTERAGGRVVSRGSGGTSGSDGDILPTRVYRSDQFGQLLPEGEVNYPVVLTATNWSNGNRTQHMSFLFNWSWGLAKSQFFGSGQAGEVWRKALWIVATAFLVLELLALVAAVWMTRAVTGTVHKLYRAVEFVKRGDFSHRVRVRSQDQLGELAVAFNDMSANIETLLEERVERERLEREVEIAAEVQAQLFPRNVPSLETAEIAAECRAARGVAGDYYDYIEVAPGLVTLALGDVSGKGVSASLVMSNLQASLRAQATITAERIVMAERAGAAEGSGSASRLSARTAPEPDMAGVVARKMANINRQLCQSTESNRFATLFLALYEDRTQTLRYTNAGHNAPIVVRASGAVERLTVGGLMVGAFDWAAYDEAAAPLRPGDLLLVFSDGISEAENEAGEEYGEERLVRFAVEHRGLSAAELRGAVFEEIDAWSGSRERGDDQTLMIVKGWGE